MLDFNIFLESKNNWKTDIDKSKKEHEDSTNWKDILVTKFAIKSPEHNINLKFWNTNLGYNSAYHRHFRFHGDWPNSLKTNFWPLFAAIVVVGATVAKWLVRLSPDRAVRVRALAGDNTCCVFDENTLPRCTNGYRRIFLLGVTLRWTSKDTSRVMLLKQEISSVKWLYLTTYIPTLIAEKEL